MNQQVYHGLIFNQDWVAKTECSDLGLGYALITNDQWMTIATNIANKSSNWDGGNVGATSSINVGHNVIPRLK